MKKKTIEKAPYDRKLLWAGGIIIAMVFSIHLSAYLLSIFVNNFTRPYVQLASEFIRTIIPGAWYYETQNRTFLIPHIQLLASIFITTPFAFLAVKSMACYDINRADTVKNVDGVFNFKFNTLLLLLLGLIVLLLPPSGFIRTAHSTYYGVLAPFRYSLASSIIGYSARVLVTRNWSTPSR